MGGENSRIARERELLRLEREREDLRRAREEQEKERNLYRRAREDLEAQQVQEALKRSKAEARSQLYPDLNPVFRNETYQNAAAPSLAVNHEHFRFQPSAPPPFFDPIVHQPSETRTPPARPRPPTVQKPASETGITAASQTNSFRASVSAPQAAAPQANEFRSTVSAPQANKFRATVSAPQAAAPQANEFRSTVSAPQANKFRATVSAPKAAAPQANEFRSTVSAPQANKFRASVSATQAAAAPQAAAPREKKVFKRKDDGKNCQTCKKSYEDKIFICKNGHSACERCWSFNLSCGQCRGPITTMRNFTLEEQIAANRKVKCPNSADGCILSFKQSELTKHEKECPFKELKCPALENCNWVGKPSQLSIHFDENHPYSMQANVDTEMVLPNICNEYNSLQLIKLGNYNFLFYVKVSEIERRVYMDIQLIGTKASASKWYYEIHVYNKREPRRKYLYVDSVHSSNEPSGISFNNSAVLPLLYAMSFVNEGNLTYKIFIKKTFNDKPN